MSVIVYSTNTCPFCTLAKDYLKKLNVSYSDIKVDEDENKAREMIDKSGQMGVPVLDINGYIVVGFDRARIDAALKDTGAIK